MAESWEGAAGALVDDEEKRVLFAALDSFREYRRAAHYNITHRRRQNFYALPDEQWKMLAAPPFNMLSHFDQVDDAIDANADIASAILESGLEAFGVPTEPNASHINWHGCATLLDMEKAKSTIRQFYRDWSREGELERQSCYQPVLEDLQHLFAKADWCSVRVLVPGAGLGRLVFEVCRLGFAVEGNEISFHQLISSNWILNQVSQNERYDLYPFALSFSNHLSRSHQLHCVKVPDVHPGSELAMASQGQTVHAFERMSMTAADFVVLYSDDDHKEKFDAVTTVYFIDTAPNLIRYLQTIHHTLRPGGYWINLGPLLWHFEDRSARSDGGNGAETPLDAGTRRPTAEKKDEGIGEQGSVELTLEEVLLLAERMGFRIKQHAVREASAGYIQDPSSLLVNRYACAHFVAQRIP